MCLCPLKVCGLRETICEMHIGSNVFAKAKPKMV